MLCGALPLHRAGAVFRGRPLLPLEQTCYLCVFRDINFLGCRYSGKAGHLNDLSGKNNDKARTCADVSVADRNVEAFRPPELLLIIRKRVLRLRDADRKVAEAKIRQCADGFLRLRRCILRRPRRKFPARSSESFLSVQDPENKEAYRRKACFPAQTGPSAPDLPRLCRLPRRLW